MRYSELNGTKVSKLGLGTMRLPQEADGSVNYEKACAIIDASLEKGITYIDTAYTYLDGNAEKMMKKALVERHPRESFQLITKLPTWLIKSEADAKRIFQEQLDNCGVTYFDFFLIHDIEKEWYENIEKGNIVPYLKQEKANGRIKHLGASFHCKPEMLRDFLQKYGEDIEFIQLQINYLDWDFINAKAMYDVAVEFNKTIVIMEPLRGGTLANVPGKEAKAILDAAKDDTAVTYADFAFGWLEALPNVGWILSGMNDVKQVEENTAFFEREHGLSKEQVEAAAKAGQAMRKEIFVPCTGCRYCKDCPQGINIAKIFSVYNEAAAKDFNYLWGKLSDIYKRVGANGADCVQCGACESACPQHINIRDLLQEIHQKYEALAAEGK